MVKRYSSHDYTESETGWLVPKTDYDALVAHYGTLAPGGSHTCITCAAHCVVIEDQEARIAQLEAALKRIADYSPGFTPIAGDPIEIARSALAVSEGENG